MKKIMFSILFISLAFCLSAQNVDEKYWKNYSSQLEKTVVGMSLEDFKKIWPEAKGPYSDFHDKEISLYSFSLPPRPFSLMKGVRIIYFTFKEDILLSWVDK